MAKNPKTAEKYKGVVDENGKWTGTVNLHMDGCLHAATVTRKPKRFFIGSMTDIFHENIPDEEIRSLFLSMTIVPNDFSTYMVLTKRPHRARAVLEDMLISCPELHRVWLGVTVCNQAEADEKIPVLLQTPAAVRFVSVEPCLGPVDLSPWDVCDECGHRRNEFDPYNDVGSPWVGSICYNHYCDRSCEGTFSKHALDWVICGGETGPGARPMHPDWVRGLRDQCQGARVPFFFKSWGEWLPSSACPDGFDAGAYPWTGVATRPQAPEEVYLVGKRRAGRLLDGRTWNEFPEKKNEPHIPRQFLA